jgi:hypothetical protein
MYFHADGRRRPVSVSGQRVRSASPPRAYCPYPLFAFASAREGLEVHNLLIRELPAYLEYTGDTGLRAGRIPACVRERYRLAFGDFGSMRFCSAALFFWRIEPGEMVLISRYKGTKKNREMQGFSKKKRKKRFTIAYHLKTLIINHLISINRKVGYRHRKKSAPLYSFPRTSMPSIKSRA